MDVSIKEVLFGADPYLLAATVSIRNLGLDDERDEPDDDDDDDDDAGGVKRGDTPGIDARGDAGGVVEGDVEGVGSCNICRGLLCLFCVLFCSLRSPSDWILSLEAVRDCTSL